MRLDTGLEGLAARQQSSGFVRERADFVADALNNKLLNSIMGEQDNLKVGIMGEKDNLNSFMGEKDNLKNDSVPALLNNFGDAGDMGVAAR